MGGASYTSVEMGLLGGVTRASICKVPGHAPHYIGERVRGRSGCPRPVERARDSSSLVFPAAGSAEP